MLAWAHEALGVVQITAEIFEDNRPSCALHERLGFVQTGRRGLRRHVDGDRVVYRPLAEGDDAEPDRWWIRVVRTRRASTRMKAADHIAAAVAAAGCHAGLRGRRRDDRLRHRCVPHRWRCPTDQHAPRAGRGVCRRGRRADDWRAGLRDGHQRPGCHQPADRRRLVLLRLDAGGVPLRTGHDRRPARRPAGPPAGLPGDRRCGDGGADHQGGLARARRGGAARAAGGRLRAGARRAPGPGPARRADGPAGTRRRRPRRAGRRRATRHARPRRGGPRARRAGRSAAPADPRWRWAAQRRRHRCAGPLCRARRRAGRALADGRRRAAGRPSAARRDDRHLRQPLGQHRDRTQRPDRRAR